MTYPSRLATIAHRNAERVRALAGVQGPERRIEVGS